VQRNGSLRTAHALRPAYGRVRVQAIQSLLQQIINGIQIGSVYALIAVGYTMVYGVLRFINFAHGDVYMLGAFFGSFTVTALMARHAPPPVQGALGLLMAMIACAIVGVIIERSAYKPVRKSGRMTALITAIGVSLLLENAAQAAFGASPRAFVIESIDQPITLSLGAISLSFNKGQGLVLIAAVLLTTVLVYIVRRTTIGKAIRAVSFDREVASLMGVNTDVVITFTFLLGSALAGAAGLMNHGFTRQPFDPLIGILFGLKAFVAAVLGGIGNIAGAVLGGLLMGLTEAFVSSSQLSSFRDAFAFLILIAVLLFKPAGLLGQNVTEKV
jgi:branched-chain amino acid transport system permease protein